MADKPILKTSIPSAHAASTAQARPSQPRPAGPMRQQQQQQQPPRRQQPPSQQSKPAPDPRHLAIAMHHAHRIQAQKDAESLILDRILELVSFPTAPNADPAAPSASDAKALKSALRPFQPADYDNLILERNIEGLCGYALCPREHRKEDPKTKFRIVWGAKGSGAGGRGREMKVVPKEKLEMWCSDECAERAMYVRVQLTEEPVWERRADDGRGKEILLLEEARAMKGGNHKGKNVPTVRDVVDGLRHLDMGGGSSRDAEMLEDMSRLAVSDDRDGSRELAVERGDSNPAFRAGRVDVHIVEKDQATAAAAPVPRPEDYAGGSIEGYTPRDARPDAGNAQDEDDDNDMLDMI
ncbi:hypothetical protein DTO166G4_6599 [Paecilomyces variotii]|uniref:RNA polymerase II subunit B1 CTD phosphatase RPAP2 homolog n=1 Tax=Byssochlamys spectabilis TaxID=264951 RepID=A0A443HUJ9_BYSSP|nr:Rtr1/RPAP2 family-domain-containing protein [Paecilomyces variotii]KAJ9211826.1 hypothetical protein DTO166G4_6599 [Paecilomyces variotii]KAJ9228515.1 hypothetical protein DTO169E5_9162 [Paecilomyces variotii]KAJ9236484.1 hypothetical protein DTO166G5_3949 [Paecilomyces variotii]KAJ9256420.1 hypothetical protein DTO195F2_5828 [Paecilomyces variotii]KAJ9364764.1 hypothetical protein DTO280E4_1059 [Paecilomyces variotii]